MKNTKFKSENTKEIFFLYFFFSIYIPDARSIFLKYQKKKKKMLKCKRKSSPIYFFIFRYLSVHLNVVEKYSSNSDELHYYYYLYRKKMNLKKKQNKTNKTYYEHENPKLSIT